ncbi:MAG: lipooligosaccharide transport system permease protein [Alphaproteobacteria bacterium]|jgi:lipooligosaccharide transport system permease protein
MLALLRRNFIVLKRSWHFMLFADVLDNVVWLSLFVYGFAIYMPDIKGVSYQSFVIPGYFLFAGLYQLGMESTHRFYAKIVHNPWWVSLLATPLGVRRMVYSELFWVVLRSSVPVVVVFVLAYSFGLIVNMSWLFMGLPLVFALYFFYASCSLLFTLFMKNDENFIYYWVVFISPIFVVSGAFFDSAQLPAAFQMVIKLYPVSYVTAPLQNVMLWGHVNIYTYGFICLILLVSTIATMYLCELQLKRRFLK